MNCKVMGIVNVTPDSFSDGGKFFRPEEAVRRARNLIRDGADIIDIGGESTRPGSTPITWDEEWNRIEPVLTGLGTADSGLKARISVDTYHPETAERALAIGVGMINCVYEESAADMARIVSAHPDAELVIPAKVLPKCPESLMPRCYIDPMIGFGTTREEDLELIRSVPELAKKGRVLVGASRKRIIKRLTGEKVPGKDIAGNLALALWCAQHGASCIRVHDVFETVQALKVYGLLI